ncbi:MAG: type VI secretion system contractile sheath large subunit [Gammaproteobacteria bacterium]|nr:type VI secretion system contractile sheath large subunit [Gammaproteobacteria bacterium]
MQGSIQEKLTRIRPPRVKITYDVETGGAIEKRELPFIVGIFADLSGEPLAELPPVKDRKMVEIDRDNFDAVMASALPTVKLSDIANVLPGGSGNLTGALSFSSMDQFGPLEVVKKVAAMQALYTARSRVRDMHTKTETSDALARLLDDMVAPGDEGKKLRDELKAAFDPTKPEEWVKVTPAGTVEKLLTKEYMLLDENQREHVLNLIGQFVTEIVVPITDGTDKGAGNLMVLRVAEIDEALGKQLNLIMHAPNFQKMEATWRGLHYLVMRSETGKLLKLRIMNVAKRELLKDLQKAVEFDQSTIFKLIYEAEYGTYGGDPYSMLVGDYDFGRHPEDIELLYKMAEIAAAAHAPFISSAYARLFDIDTFEKLTRPRDLTKIFESAELDGWRSFRQSEDSRYVTLTLPRVLLRLPYGPNTVTVEGIDFVEEANGRDASKFLWGNSAFILAQRVTNAFSLYGWTAAIRGVEGGGLVEGLPTYKFKTNDGDIEIVCPTQIAITDRREKELNDLGFMAICHCKGTNKAAFFGGQTTNQPKKYISDAANSNAQISAMLPYVLAASRFAHYIKVIMREKVGTFLTRTNIEQFLNSWIAQYVLLDDNATQDVKAAYPLRAALINVTEVPGKPGAYRAVVFLRPHFQLEELTTSIRLVADIPG